MADSYKDIIITPNRSNTADPKIEFRGANSSVNAAISMLTYPTSNGTLSFEGTAGQLFSVTNDLTGSIFSVNDVSGIPSIEVFANGQINFAQYGGNITVGGNTTFGAADHLILSSTSGISANGTFGSAGQGLVSNGSAVYWSNNPGYTGSQGAIGYTGSSGANVNANTQASTANLAVNSDTTQHYAVTAQAAAINIDTDAGTPTEGKKLLIRIKDNGVSRAITWANGVSKSYRAVGITLPTATTISKTTYVGFVYNTTDSRWDGIGVTTEA